MIRDKRKKPRIEFRLPVMIKGQPGLKKIKDFSLCGLFIEVQNASQFKPGDEIDLLMKLPDHKNAIQVRARVVRVAQKGIGVEFIDMNPQHAMALEFCFHVFKNTIPLPGS
ncbi:MAG: PilZ domain-containing protein [Deltaproteobacteria bacterium]|nr:PilZ domain-containing protein [Deltaproteobacteria bacterium]MBW2019630.1 PilZ domain-containing protein [Deltaproteobacteria bacterium]MBW2074445.1 PilZ domain-containing protein [Deltaproteobacteria bacterium]RLB82383.1 MAG: hypothetical protein DRH17_06140 [Deltaproteobacteria bacterium]